MRNFINLIEAANKGCPLPTQDLDLNLKNRDKAIKEYHYGPANPGDPGNYWKEVTKLWDVTEKIAKTMRCANCAAFDVSDKMRECISSGIKGDHDGVDGLASVQVGDIGYCNFHHFKCAGQRTCLAWVEGGPIDDKDLTK